MENNRNKKPIKYSAITLGIVLATAFILVQPTIQASYAQVGADRAPKYGDCQFNSEDQFEDPWSMNTVKSAKVAKTIIAEKELFRCDTDQGGIDLIVDVTTIVEIFENMTTKNIISKKAVVITCAKLDSDVTLLGCNTYEPGTSFIPVTDCAELSSTSNGYLQNPQEMNTVVQGKTVKTIIAQKEIVRCNFNTPTNYDDDKKVEQYTIEEIWEDTAKLPGNTIVKKVVESVRCTTLIHEAEVESCIFATVPLTEVKITDDD